MNKFESKDTPLSLPYDSITVQCVYLCLTNLYTNIWERERVGRVYIADVSPYSARYPSPGIPSHLGDTAWITWPYHYVSIKIS